MAASALALASTVTASDPHPRSSVSLDRHTRLRKRASIGESCGPDAGSCDDGLCCSSGGFCGTGGEYCTSPGCQLPYGPACHGNITPEGADTSDVSRPKFGKVPYGVDITACTTPGTMALSFDDGPYHYTDELLNLLKKNGVVATFYVTGMNGAKGAINDPSTENPDLLRRMLADGHQIGSHSWSHEDMQAVSAEERHNQIIKNEIALADLFGFFPTYYRPPYTSCGGECMSELASLGYHVTNYNLDTKDWEVDGAVARMNYESFLAGVTPQSAGVIALAHDIHPDTVHSLAQFMIDKARSQGYKLVTVGDCLGDPQSNWYRDAKSGNPISSSLINNAAANSASTSSTSKNSVEKAKGAGRNKATPSGTQAGGSKATQTPQADSAAVNEDAGGSSQHESGAARGLGKRALFVIPLALLLFLV